MVRVLFLLSLLLAGEAAADCLDYVLEVFPLSPGVLPLKPLIVVEGYREARSLLSEPFRWQLIEASGEAVLLRVVETLEGYRAQQLVLVPEQPLRANTSYELTFVGASELFKFYPRPVFRWRTRAEVNGAVPLWVGDPQPGDFEFRQMGCGPYAGVPVSVATTDHSPIAYEVRLDDGRKYYLFASKGRIRIGHGMCVGAFNLQEGTRYVAEIIPVDAAGNRGAERGVRFETPPLPDR